MSLSKYLSVMTALCGAVSVHGYVDVLLKGSPAITGADVNSMLGRDVRNIGDFNHDGVSDILVSGFKCNPEGNDCSGLTYVLFGGEHVSNLDLAHFKPGFVRGFRVFSPLVSIETAPAISGAGDVNGDGYDDLMVQNQHTIAVIYGFNTSTLPVEDIHLGRFISNANGFEIVSPGLYSDNDSTEQSNVALEGAGDVNGDGVDDMLICYPDMSPLGREKAGLCYVVFGTVGVRDKVNLDDLSYSRKAKTDTASADTNTNTLINTNTTATTNTTTTTATNTNTATPLGFRILGPSAGDRIGTPILANLDLNDDGIADIVINALSATYVVFGQKSMHIADVDLSVPTVPTSVLQIKNIVSHGNCAYTLAALTDANGDGVNDLAIGCGNTNSFSGPNTGSVTVVFGHSECDPFLTHVDLNAFIEGVQGFRVYGPHQYAYFGQSVSSGGDLNGDGRTDILVGAQGDDGNNVVYVVYSREPNSLTTGTESDTTTTTSTATTTVGTNSATTTTSDTTPTTTLFSDIDMSVQITTGNLTRIVSPEQDNHHSGSVVGVIRNIGDFNGDGKSDILLSDPRGSRGSSGDRKNAGVVYVVNGL